MGPTRSVWDTMTCPPTNLKALRDYLLHVFALTPNSTPTKAIYVSRKTGDRAVMNEDALIHALQTWSRRAAPHLEWSVFEGASSLRAQAALFSRAALVVGPHGAGLVNVL